MRDLASSGNKVKVIQSDTVGLVRKKIWGDSKEHLYNLIQSTGTSNMKLPYLTLVYPSELYQGNLGKWMTDKNYRTTVLCTPRLLLYWKLWFHYGSLNTLNPKMNKPHDWSLTTTPHFSKIVPRTDEAAVHCPPEDPWITRIQLLSNLETIKTQFITEKKQNPKKLSLTTTQQLYFRTFPIFGEKKYMPLRWQAFTALQESLF